MALDFTYRQLPDELSERVRWLNEHDVGEGPVVYWFHRCLRLEENPALDTALHLAATLNRPLALVAELSTQRDPYASMRHWTFELEGLLELRAQLSEQHIPLDIYVESDDRPGSRYRAIAEQAGLLVAEDLPVASERAFRTKLAEVVQVPFLVVDASCVIPMNHSKKPIRRAFAFRDRYKDIIEAASRSSEPPSREWPDITFRSLSLDGVLKEETDVAKVLSSAPVDHSVAPLSDTRGGRRAGLQRWRTFVESQGLRRYAKRRNDALGDGVSRMSAYLHYGFVAPFELVRWGNISEKYIDELVVWRELAWHYCKTVPNHHSADCLPEWATSSLTSYGQGKPSGPDWQQLWDGETDDPFWNSCQRSLRELGELHNNIRMTWGKALVEWAASPQQALTWLTELNHRLALDGNDPASYGGLLWCLGEFDRPFKPAKPVWGEVRDRSTQVHAQRCPPEALSAWVEGRNGYHGARVGIVGAGVTAIAAALSLRAHGVHVTLWDKGYNPGGRVARRPTAGEGGIEHGTQSFSITGTSLQHKRFLEHCRAWSGGTHLQEFDDSPNGFHGVGNLQGWLRELIRPFAFHRQTAVSRIALNSTDIEVLGPDESLGTFDAVIATVPAPQMAPLVDADLQADLRPLDEIVYQPSIVVAAAWPEGAAPPAAELSRCLGGGTVSRQHGAPGLSTWTIEAPPQWSGDHLEMSKDELTQLFIRACEESGEAPPLEAWAHRWRYARVERPLGAPYWAEKTSRLFWAGDGAFGGGVEGAWCSGERAAAALLARFRDGLPQEG